MISKKGQKTLSYTDPIRSFTQTTTRNCYLIGHIITSTNDVGCLSLMVHIKVVPLKENNVN